MSGIIGRAAGSTGFKYSGAMKKSGITWTDKHIFMFIKAPAKYVAGINSIDNSKRANFLV